MIGSTKSPALAAREAGEVRTWSLGHRGEGGTEFHPLGEDPPTGEKLLRLEAEQMSPCRCRMQPPPEKVETLRDVQPPGHQSWSRCALNPPVQLFKSTSPEAYWTAFLEGKGVLMSC